MSEKVEDQSKKRDEDVISYHTFMFPFRWDRISGNHNTEEKFFKEVPLEKRIKIDGSFHEELKLCGWKYEKFNVGESCKKDTKKDDIGLLYKNYNEYFYFHSFVNRVLYNQNEEFKENQTSYYYEKLEFEGKYFEIKIKQKISEKQYDERIYKLTIDGISLRVFETGIAIFSINLKNFSYKDSVDILKINDFGRRFYAQFLNKSENKDHSEKARENFLPESIKIYDKDNNTEFESKFKYEKIPNEIEIAEYIMFFLNGSDRKNIVEKYRKEEFIIIHPILDDRMFVLSYYQNKDISNTLNKFSNDKYSYFQSDFWYKYLFVEWSNKTCQSKVLSKKLLEDSTYDRWIDYGTLFGITRYSFVLIFSSYWAPLYDHFRTMYFQMFNLLLAQRASILRFSHEASLISDLKESEISAEKISSLYLHYMKFINKLWFREITAQEQGIEMYDLAVKQMRLKEEIEALDNEIKELNDFMTLQIENSRNEEAIKLNKIATLFLPATLLTGIFGMNIFPDLNIELTQQSNFMNLSLSIFIIITIYSLVILNIKNFKRILSFNFLAKIVTFIIISSIFLFFNRYLLEKKFYNLEFEEQKEVNLKEIKVEKPLNIKLKEPIKVIVENKSSTNIGKPKPDIDTKKDNKKESNKKPKQK